MMGAPPPPHPMQDPSPQPAPPNPVDPAAAPAAPERAPNFAEVLAEFESHGDNAGATGAAAPQPGEHRTGTVVSLREDVALIDIGAKAEGVLPLEVWRSQGPGTELEPGAAVEVIVEGRDPEGSFKLSPFTPDRPRNLEDARAAFQAGLILRGKVTGAIKGGLTVDVGMRGFIPLSKTGVRDPGELHKLVGQEIRCRIARDPSGDGDAPGNLILDRRTVVEQAHKEAQRATLEHMQEGDEVEGTVTSLTTYGAFVDVGGIDALLHISDLSWGRVAESAHLLALNQALRVKVLKVDRAKGRISVGLRQMSPDPWAGVAERFNVGDRVSGTVRRLSDFGAFVEVAPGVEGLIHISEMSWSRRVHKPGDMVQVGDTVEAVVLGVNAKDRRLSLGLKQALGDPWADAETKFRPGTVIEGRVRNLQQFGAFIEIAEGVDGMVHISDIAAERLAHPNAVLKVGDTVRAQVLELDVEKRRLRLGMKQLIPTPLETFITSHTVGETLSGRVVKAYPGRVQLDEGIEAACPSAAAPVRRIEEGTFAAKLRAASRTAPAVAPPEAPTGIELKSGEVRTFRITHLDPEHAKIEVEPA
ncbi:MAG TPA: S1 RNA-binding domain-containing protein [Terriglobales bacterium]